MENLTTAISVQVDSKDKEIASGILKKIGFKYEYLCKYGNKTINK